MRLHLFHKWQELVEWKYDRRLASGKAIVRHYRRCLKCTKWQKRQGAYEAVGWDDCAPPDEVGLVSYR